MSYAYEVWSRGDESTGYQHTLVNAHAQFDTLEEVFKESSFYVSVRKDGVADALLLNPDDLADFRLALERAHAWKPEKLEPVDNNKKTAVALNKPRISDVPPVAMFAMGAAMSDGAAKYGRYNWRDDGATVSVFVDAMARHLLDYWNGEDFAHDSRVHHLAHLMAGGAILLDAALHGKLNDDRGLHKPEGISRLESYWKLVKKDD